MVQHVPIGIGLQEPHPDPDALPDPAQVLGVLQVTVVERGLLRRVGGSQADVPGATRHAESAGDPRGAYGGDVSGAVAGSEPGNPFLPLVDHIHRGQHQIVVDFGVRCGADQPVVGSIQVCGQVHIVLDLEVDVDAQVVEQALAYPG